MPLSSPSVTSTCSPACATAPEEIDLPARFSLFGHTRIPVTEVELLSALGEHRDVHLWLPHPSDALWAALTDLRGAVPRVEDVSHERVAHPLLASLGRDVRELQRTLQTVVAERAAGRPGAAEPDRRARTPCSPGCRATSPPTPPSTPRSRTLAAEDAQRAGARLPRAARQVEVLREVLLGLLADDPTLEPRDIMVMCPDIESYAPLISAAFGMGRHRTATPATSSGSGWPTGR